VQKAKKRPKRRRDEYELTLDIEDLAVKEALNDVLAINEAIPKEPPVKSPELQEFIQFKEECEALFALINQYKDQEEEEADILSEDFDLKRAMKFVKKLVGIDDRKSEEYIEGEPSEYAKMLFQKVWQKYIDCKWFFSTMKGKKPVTPKELKYLPAPEDLIKATGEMI